MTWKVKSNWEFSYSLHHYAGTWWLWGELVPYLFWPYTPDTGPAPFFSPSSASSFEGPGKDISAYMFKSQSHLLDSHHQFRGRSLQTLKTGLVPFGQGIPGSYIPRSRKNVWAWWTHPLGPIDSLSEREEETREGSEWGPLKVPA